MMIAKRPLHTILELNWKAGDKSITDGTELMLSSYGAELENEINQGMDVEEKKK